jgi:hypothetical protein
MKTIRPLVPLFVLASLGAISFSCGSFSSGTSSGTGGAGATGIGSGNGGTAGTSSSGSAGTSGGVAGTSGSGTAGTSGGAAGTGGPTCATGTLLCGATCITPATDNANCGTCGTACSSDKTCQSGSCACTTGRVLCAGSTTCIDTTSDSANCGGCGKACTTGQVCSNGTCSTTCATGTSACSGACVNLQTDISHCGTCTTTCSAANNLTCTAGACVCITGQTSCSGTCTNLMTDAANCGTCGKACASGQTCNAGACACPTGQSMCSNVCKNLQTDVANCGTCAKACATGQTCASGVCTGGTTTFTGPCDILAAAGNTCAAAHSTVRALYGSYTGSLYQVCKGSSTTGPNSCKGTTMDIGVVAGGYANAAAQDTFCAGATCTISIIYDQSSNGNHLHPSPTGQRAGALSPASATALKLTLNGHEVYGVQILTASGYRAGCNGCASGQTAKGTATGDLPETEYMVTSQNGLLDGCCFDYGNAETTNNDDNDGTMEAVYFGGGVSWDFGSTGVRTDPFVMADLENGLFAGFSTTNPSAKQTIASNTPLKFNYVTALIVGDTAAQNSGQGRFAIYGGDATTGAVKTMYDGIRPTLGGYVPMKKQGSIILGTGGDNSDSSEGHWFEGVMASGAATITTINAVQANIVAAGYGK